MKLSELLGVLDEPIEDFLLANLGEAVVAGVTSDSRSVEAGFVFVGIPGLQVDGTQFVPQALENGAVLVVVSDQSDFPPDFDARGKPILRIQDPHLALARLAGAYFPAPLEQVAAVTGTNGKTSIASFLRQIWASQGIAAANIGTIGIEGPKGTRYGGLTTPDPVGLMQSVQGLVAEGVTHLALEASSHGLEQKRLDCLSVDIGAFTNLTRDHLDYHGTFEAYRAAKSQLFSRLVRDGGTAIINLDDPSGAHFLKVAKARRLTCLTVGRSSDADLIVRSIDVEGFDQRVHLGGIWGEIDCFVPLVGSFQVSNALVAGLMAYAGGLKPQDIIDAICGLTGARGRMELVGQSGADTAIYVDYSHTPDSLEVALKALRPFVKGRLICVFGAGGDRDTGKRPLMGQASNNFADYSIVTDDNPRSEDPALIRAAVMETVTNGVEVAGRQKAISLGVDMMTSGDILLVAGKGHETGQTIKGEILPFSDHEAIAKALAEIEKGAAL
ncbi:UDP-N-acetylmuramoyl-L-alanyl-D-glutamate--2,6-diaminopimelate ligase [Cohaesibacter celericrescens]|uniref:UDP-N-acetylmuramoyl-L-alanyl-D-glutamate--2,6-diaminopimelate ligase n=1 Tax=Cohaesibacter celericrescens TaxID=2067669 RepID=A0A2N5XWW9_9HYPH|nr:UDP-N-acetylmuramoyl-L-alanyl-D-glutamate--2,6-diaminopimelate ligase [Cohaesibacter celericrescens]PLW75550.1 UDP-N-acetylmuramoyl-L-alanyl-D-glutamate--2,6-diaminopimelate ligase [Cohaesibacter celericrescens]PLW78957.1 UDP-N-acetylmuramoyl-L-alanyl-D-glutamate--2,6-diaminopimelate ligase [Cohaesibacter celericrescens]